MIRRCLSLLVIAGCATTRTAPKPTHEAAAGKSVSTVPRPRFDVVPAELADANVLSRLRSRVVVRRWDIAYLAQDGDAIGKRNARDDANDVVPVLEVGKKIRIVIEDDGARLAVWISPDNARSTVLAPTVIGSEQIGVMLRPGVPLALGEQSARGRAVTFSDQQLVVTAVLAPERIGLVYAAPDDDAPPVLGPPSTRSWSSPADSRPSVIISPSTTIHARASHDAEVLARLATEEASATRVRELGAWLEIELHRPFVRVRGFVEAARTKADGLGHVSTSGGGHGFGVSHAVTHVLPAQTCIYDRVNGDVIGVTLEARSRIGGSVAEAWAMVYVDTVWGAQKLFIKDLGDDPSTPQWETCSEDAHRR